MDRGYIESWNFFIQHEFSPTLTAEGGYVGTHAVHTMTAVNINGSLPGTGTAGRQLYPYITSDMNSYAPFGSMKYNAFQSRLRKRIGSGFIGVSYTFSKTLDIADNGDSALFRAFPESYSLNKGLAGFDRTHTFQLYHVYQLPFGKGHALLNHGMVAEIVGGFQISGTLSRYSGLPFSIGSSANLNAGGQTQSANQINPVVKILGGHDAQDPYFDGTAFANPTCVCLGTTGRDILRGPGVFNINQSVSRTFSLKEGKVRLQLVGEAFNLTNTPSFSNPGATFTTPTVNAAGAITSYGGYSTISSTTSQARQLQVGGYLRF
jgi:hypothetical protein